MITFKELHNEAEDMAPEIAAKSTSERDETLAHAYYSAGVLPVLRVARFEYAAPRRGLLGQVAERLGARLNAPLAEGHRALLESGATQAPEDLALAECMVAVQGEALTS